MSKLSGKIAVVTGASRGIGAAIARRLAADGAAVAVNYSASAKAANDLVGKIVAAGGTAAALQADVSDAAQVRFLFDTVKKNHGRVDIVVNNAGTWAMAPLAKFTAEHYQRLFNLNVFGPLLITSEAIKHFPPTGGRIVNISSIAAHGAMADGAVYAASKAALEALTRNWALELGPRKITVNAVAPGVTETEMTAVAPAEFKNLMASKTPLGRLGRPEDIADVVAFLASDDARWITGEVLSVSGGLVP